MIKVSPQEYKVIELLAQGLSNGQIAQLLGITRRSVESYLHIVYQKLEDDHPNRTKLATAFMKGCIESTIKKQGIFKERIINLLKSGLTTNEISAKLGCTKEAVNRYKRKMVDS